MSQPMFSRRALIVEDDAFTRALLAQVLGSLDCVTASAADGAEALAVSAEFDPDIAMVDLDLGEGPNGVDVINQLVTDSPWLACVLMSSHDDWRMVDSRSELAGDNTVFVSKQQLHDLTALTDVIDAAVAGVQLSVGAPARNAKIKITTKQAELLRLLALGLSNESIAEDRQCSVRAVERALNRLYTALGVAGDPNRNARVLAVRKYLDGQVYTSGRGM